MSSDHWQKAKQALAEALSLDASSREGYLQQLEKTSPEVAQEVRSLLAASESAEDDNFLESPAALADLEETAEYHKETAHDAEATLEYQNNQIQDEYDTVGPADGTLGKSSPGNSADSSNRLAPEDYEIERQIGKGGMGVVYKAYQQSLRRNVALKIIPERLLNTPEQIARFKIEAESAAKLDHPGIVPVYEVGEYYGVHYYSMALVEGTSLSDHVGSSRNRLEQKDAAALIEKVCHAVQYAHDRAVIHRDIKPANILLDPDGNPRLTDFGLAKTLKEDEGLTMTGQVMGTPSYMAPEQATGNQRDLSNRTDVYSLGATLYALLAGKPPFGAETLLQTIRDVAENSPPPLKAFLPDVSPDLQTICEKCLSKRPADRYESASDLAEDLNRYVNGYPIAARPLGRWKRAYLWCRRNPVEATLTFVTAATLLVATVVSTFFGIRAQQELERAEANAQKLNHAIEELFVFASENVLADEPGMQTIRATLLESAQNYYQELLDTGQTSPEQVAKSAFLLGRVQSSLGDHDAAAQSFDTALDEFGALVKSNENNLATVKALAQTHNEYARLQEQAWYANQGLDQNKEAFGSLKSWARHAEECVAWRVEVLQAEPRDVETRRLLANAKMNLGIALSEQFLAGIEADISTRTDELFKEAQKLRQELLSESTEQTKVLRDLALGYAAQADLRFSQAELRSDVVEKNELWNESLELRTLAIETLSQIPPADVTTEIDWLLATFHQVCAECHLRMQNIKDALNEYAQTQKIMGQLLLQNPRVLKYRIGLAQSQYMQSQVLLAMRDAQGYTLFEDCQKTLADAIAINPRNQEPLTVLADYSTGFAKSLAEADENSLAEKYLSGTIKLLEQIEVREQDRAAIEATILDLQRFLDTLKQKRKSVNQVA